MPEKYSKKYSKKTKTRDVVQRELHSICRKNGYKHSVIQKLSLFDQSRLVGSEELCCVICAFSIINLSSAVVVDSQVLNIFASFRAAMPMSCDISHNKLVNWFFQYMRSLL
ncbi:hypothetical protein GSD1FS_1497 [Bifidobacterium sp. GSD1FS]|uniref:Uncharacterized protein n=1 Tax=Bifidobacterium canis TaxID=2610880 RepID=A0A7K1J657_9BIFI|nr:hypothetical protein [Bifidobacterium canis]